jgi:hypothetical protein
LFSFDKDCVPGPPESEPGTSISPHASFVFFTDGGGTLREWETLSRITPGGSDVALFNGLVGSAGLEEGGKLRR